MGYVKEKLTPENCIRIQNDLANEPPRGHPDVWQMQEHKKGPRPDCPTNYKTPRGELSTDDSWVVDRERNYYAARLTYVLELRTIVLFLDGEIYVLETEDKSRVLKPLEIEDADKQKIVEEEAEAAIDALYRGRYYFKEDKK